MKEFEVTYVEREGPERFCVKNHLGTELYFDKIGDALYLADKLNGGLRMSELETLRDENTALKEENTFLKRRIDLMSRKLNPDNTGR